MADCELYQLAMVTQVMKQEAFGQLDIENLFVHVHTPSGTYTIRSIYNAIANCQLYYAHQKTKINNTQVLTELLTESVNTPHTLDICFCICQKQVVT